MICEGLRTLFLAEATITSLLNRPSAKFSGCYVTKAPQKAPPAYLLLTEMGRDDKPRLDGTGGLSFSEVDVDCKAATSAAASRLAKAVDDYFKDYTGAAGDLTVEAVIKQSQSDDYEDLGDSHDEGRHIVTLEYQVQFRF